MTSERNDAIIKASQLGEFACCRRGWWPSHGQGLETGNVAALARGRLRLEIHRRWTRHVARPRQFALTCLPPGLVALAVGSHVTATVAGGRA